MVLRVVMESASGNDMSANWSSLIAVGGTLLGAGVGGLFSYLVARKSSEANLEMQERVFREQSSTRSADMRRDVYGDFWLLMDRLSYFAAMLEGLYATHGRPDAPEMGRGGYLDQTVEPKFALVQGEVNALFDTYRALWPRFLIIGSREVLAVAPFVASGTIARIHRLWNDEAGQSPAETEMAEKGATLAALHAAIQSELGVSDGPRVDPKTGFWIDLVDSTPGPGRLN